LGSAGGLQGHQAKSAQSISGKVHPCGRRTGPEQIWRDPTRHRWISDPHQGCDIQIATSQTAIHQAGLIMENKLKIKMVGTGMRAEGSVYELNGQPINMIKSISLEWIAGQLPVIQFHLFIDEIEIDTNGAITEINGSQFNPQVMKKVLDQITNKLGISL
jgi:hypothetical protein